LVPTPFWGEATFIAVYTINRLPTPILAHCTPHERLFGSSPTYHQLRVFGSVCFVLLQPYERTKLEPRSQLCYFLGYGVEQKGYRCYDPVSHRLRISRVTSSAHTSPPALRRSTRVKSLPSHLQDFHFFHALATLHEPHSYREASTNPLWQDAIKEELDALHKNHTWDLVDLPRGKSVVGCKWVYKIKTCSDGTVDRYKARFVARGFTQEYGVDYEETFCECTIGCCLLSTLVTF